MAKKVMSWSQCKIEHTASSDKEIPSTGWTQFGTIKDKSATIETSDGDTLEAKSTGGHLVARETLEGTMTLTFRIIEPDDEFFEDLGLSTDGKNITTDVVDETFAIKITPHNVGAIGIVAPLCDLSVKTGWSEEEGNYADVTASVLHGNSICWYARFVTTADEEDATTADEEGATTAVKEKVGE